MEPREQYTTEDDRYEVRDARTEERFFVDNIIVSGYGPKIGVYGIAVYSALCMHSKPSTQKCWPSHRTIAQEIGCSPPKVKDALRDLERFKLIRIDPYFDKQTGRQTSNTYTLLDPPDILAPPDTTDTPPQYHDRSTMNNHKNEQSQGEACANAQADAAPAGENKPEQKPTTKSETPEAVKLFRKATHRYPNKSWYDDIEAIVGDDPDNLKLWYRVCHAYVGLGWNPTNVKGMLDFFTAKRIPKVEPKGVSANARPEVDLSGHRTTVEPVGW